MNKYGRCLVYNCPCKCYDETTYAECRCKHRSHKHRGYYSDTMVECRNHKYCNMKHPEWVSLCNICVIQMGNHTPTNRMEDCPVCLDHKNMMILQLIIMYYNLV